KGLYPIVGDPSTGAAGWDDTVVRMTQVDSYGSMQVFAGKNAQDKFVTVENTGKNDAYIRTIVAVECGEGDPNLIGTSHHTTWTKNNIGVIEIDGNNYYVYEYMYKGGQLSDGSWRHENGILPAGDTSYPNLSQVYIKSVATNEDCEALDGNDNGTLDILVLSQAIQVDGFADSVTALNEGFGKTADKAAEWFGGISIPVVAPADAVDIGSSTTYEEVAALLAAGKNINVIENVTIANPESSRFTRFELNGNVGIWSDEGATLTFGETTTLSGNGVLTIYTGSIDEKQELCVSDNATIVFNGGEHTFAAFSASRNGKIVVNDGVLNCKGSYAGIMGITFGENGHLIVNDGKINLYQPINLNQNRCDAAYVEINGGTIELLDGMADMIVVRNVMDKDNDSGVLRGSSVRINGGTFIAHYEIDSDNDATAFIRNGDDPADGNKVLVSNADNYDCVVTGGTFYGSWQRADNTRYLGGNGGYGDGNMVDNSVAGFVANGYTISGDATNGYVVSAN
ncbi:MAG: hypothetical protein IKL40_05590, partial [Clostridia bacterium]|nr:hypothetical protein [Clostridia bacterium]